MSREARQDALDDDELLVVVAGEPDAPIADAEPPIRVDRWPVEQAVEHGQDASLARRVQASEVAPCARRELQAPAVVVAGH